MIDKDTLGGRITILRNAKQLSQKSLAEQLGVSTTAICKWEQNAGSPTRSNLIALCHFFSTSASWIVMGMEQVSSKTSERITEKLNQYFSDSEILAFEHLVDEMALSRRKMAQGKKMNHNNNGN